MMGSKIIVSSRIVVALALCLGLGGCGMWTSRPDTSNMPESFGKLDSPLFGCADVAGLYAWPPTQGKAYRPYKFYGNPNFLGVPTYERAQIWIKEPVSMISPMTVHSRLVNTNPNYRTSLTSQWSFKEYDKSEFKCRGGWLVLSDVLNENPNELEGHAAKRLFMGGKIGRLKDGGLVLGQKVTISGQLDSFFSWGGQSYGTYTVADHDMWYWIKLERIGATGNGVKPDDASASSNAQARSAAAGVGAKRDAEEQEARQAAQDKRIREHRAR